MLILNISLQHINPLIKSKEILNMSKLHRGNHKIVQKAQHFIFFIIFFFFLQKQSRFSSFILFNKNLHKNMRSATNLHY